MSKEASMLNDLLCANYLLYAMYSYKLTARHKICCVYPSNAHWLGGAL